LQFLKPTAQNFTRIIWQDRHSEIFTTDAEKKTVKNTPYT